MKQSPVLVQRFGGFGVQLNQHALAPQSLSFLPKESTRDAAAHEALVADLKAKIRTLAPHAVRIFFNNDQEGVLFDDSKPQSPVNRKQGPKQKERWASLVETVKFASDIGAAVNITWQGGSLVDGQRATAMTRFANVLQILVEGGAENLRWATIRNEPNTAGGSLTPAQLGDAYKQLDKLLVARGLRGQIRLMGGDLKEGSPKLSSPLHQRFWFEEFAKVGKEVEFDSLSTHIYWNYDATKRFHDRLDNVRHDLNRLTGNPNDRDSPTLKYPVPIYVTEFGTRSPDFASQGVIDPGNFHGEQGKVPMYKTTIAPFQAAWFQIVAAQMGYAGMLKWDCQFGIYDNNNKVREYHAVGRPDPSQPTAWQVWPMYHLLRLFTTTTERGWKVLPVVRDAAAPGAGTKHLVALKGATDLTILGLDDRGAPLNGKSSTQAGYEIGGLDGLTKLQLVLWNKLGGGGLHREPPVPVRAGVAKVPAFPVHAVFALTTKDLPADL